MFFDCVILIAFFWLLQIMVIVYVLLIVFPNFFILNLCGVLVEFGY